MRRPPPQNAFALLMVLAFLALLVLLVVAALSLSRSTLRSADYYSTEVATSQLAESSIDLVIAQLRAGTASTGVGTSTWASQPGALRTYGADGAFMEGHKLYSDSKMLETVEIDLASDVPPANWDTLTAHYIDLNAPVIRREPADGSEQLHFPLIDPRATDGIDAVEGFTYDPAFTGAVDGATSPGAPEKWRLPMPVEWLYVLEDGTVGHLDAAGDFQPSASVSAGNPIVGRVAFWADDETSKININTASEPTYWATPTFHHLDHDITWARSQLGEGEYQRFPGHPATVALSPVLFPNRDLDSDPNGPQIKAQIYDLVPKLADAGTRSGTVEIYNTPTPYNRNDALKEHLFASVDEFFLAPDRTPQDFDFSGSGDVANADRLARSRAFLTAHSRAPETTAFGTPRIAAWPIHTTPGEEYRTAFDELIAFCSGLGGGGNRYHFERQDDDSTSNDIGLARNGQLLGYLQDLTDLPTPGYGGSLGGSWGSNRDQILVSTFDYIRSTNLYEERLAGPSPTPGLSGSAARAPQIYSSLPTTHRTFTEGRFKPSAGYHFEGFGFFPGHGQVTPSIHADWNAKGFGRFYTVDEVVAHFICCADGSPNSYNQYADSAPTPDDIPDPWSGGGAGTGYRNRDESTSPTSTSGYSGVFYSNFPPNPSPDPAQGDAPDLATFPTTGGFPYGTDTNHPGYQPENWNLCLEDNTPLPPGTKRIQSMLFIEWFCVSAGYTILRSDFGVRVSGLSNLTINGQPLYPMDDVKIDPFHDVADGVHLGYRGGYDANYRAWLQDRHLPGRAPMPADPGYGSSAGSYRPEDLNLVSNFIEVQGDSMVLGANGPVSIEIIDPRAPAGEDLVQTVMVRFPNASTIPIPNLVTEGGTRTTRSDGSQTHTPPVSANFWSYYKQGYNGSIKGRLDNQFRVANNNHGPEWGALWYETARDVDDDKDVVFPMAPWHGDSRVVAGRPVAGEDPTSPYTVGGDGWLFAPELQAADFATGTFGRFCPGGRSTTVLHRNALQGLSTMDYTIGDLPAAWYRLPEFPGSEDAEDASMRYCDFDMASGTLLHGPFINKPDEGSLYGADAGHLPYFAGGNIEGQAGRDWMFSESHRNYFSPNRMIPSPGMFGSLPTGVVSGEPWQTLLFRADVTSATLASHPGADPAAPDHLLLDLFWMPVVEPYAISEPFSTAGKINLNYAMLPFSHIRRATALHGLMKGERIPCLPNSRITSRGYESEGAYWQRKIDIDATLGDFDSKFDPSGEATLFRTASQLCEMHLVPEIPENHSPTNGNPSDPGAYLNTSADNQTRMDAFWEAHRATGDNLRERPYTNLYGRVTTQTNTWQVHYRVQRIKKARASGPGTFDPATDRVAGEQRGSAIVERYIDPQDPALPDYTSSLDSQPPLDDFYRYRVINPRRFSP